MMSIQPTDIAIILVSLAACVYCFVLSRRLKALQDTKDGLGGTITALTKSIAAMSSTTQETRAHAGEIAARLTQLLEDANTMCARIETLSRDTQAEHTKSMEKVRATHAELITTMRETLEESKDRILDMTIHMRQMRALMNGEPQPRSAAFLDDDIDLGPETPTRYSYES